MLNTEKMEKLLVDLYTEMIWDSFFKLNATAMEKKIEEIENVNYYLKEESEKDFFNPECKYGEIFYNDSISPMSPKDMRMFKTITDSRLLFLRNNPAYQNDAKTIFELQPHDNIIKAIKDNLVILIKEYGFYIIDLNLIKNIEKKEELKVIVENEVKKIFTNHVKNIIDMKRYKKYACENVYFAYLTLLLKLQRYFIGEYISPAKNLIPFEFTCGLIGLKIDILDEIEKLINEYKEPENIEIEEDNSSPVDNYTNENVSGFIIGQIENLKNIPNLDPRKIKEIIKEYIEETIEN